MNRRCPTSGERSALGDRGFCPTCGALAGHQLTADRVVYAEHDQAPRRHPCPVAGTCARSECDDGCAYVGSWPPPPEGDAGEVER